MKIDLVIFRCCITSALILFLAMTLRADERFNSSLALSVNVYVPDDRMKILKDPVGETPQPSGVKIPTGALWMVGDAGERQGFWDLVQTQHLPGVDIGEMKAEEIPLLARCTDLQMVEISRPGALTDEIAEALTHLPKLKLLNINSAALTEKGFASLEKLTSLEILRVSAVSQPRRSVASEVTGVRHLSKLSGLKRLYLEGSISDDDVASFATLRNLEVLSVEGSPSFTGSGLASLANLKNLQVLNFARSALTDGGMSSLAKFVTLQELDVSMSRVGASLLDVIDRLSALTYLSLEQTAVPLRDALAFRKKKPKHFRIVLPSDGQSLPVRWLGGG